MMRKMNWKHWGKVKLFVAVACGTCCAKALSPMQKAGLSEKVVTGDVKSENCDPKSGNLQDNKLTLRQVQVFFRHGARTPLQIIHGVEQASYQPEFVFRVAQHTLYWYTVLNIDGTPLESSPFDYEHNKTKLKGGGSAGMLTGYGQDQMFLLGRRLRRDYVYTNFLSPTYSDQDVLVRSTNMSRTITSARCVLAGVFGAMELRKICPVTIVTCPPVDEVLFPNDISCQILKDVRKAAMADFDDIPGLKEDRIEVERALGIDSATDGHKINFIHLRDDIIARHAHGWIIARELLPFMDLIEKNACKMLYFAMCGKTEDERKVVMPLSVGPAITMSVDVMCDTMNGKRPKKICLYSTHDSLIIGLLEAFGLRDDSWPPFAADVTLELYEDENQQFWVQVKYCGKEVVIQGCDETVCTFERFSELVKPYLIEKKDFLRRCRQGIVEKKTGGSWW